MRIKYLPRGIGALRVVHFSAFIDLNCANALNYCEVTHMNVYDNCWDILSRFIVSCKSMCVPCSCQDAAARDADEDPPQNGSREPQHVPITEHCGRDQRLHLPRSGWDGMGIRKC